MIYSPLRYTLHVSGDNPTHHQEYYGCICDLSYKQVTRCAMPYCLRGVTRANSFMVGCCTRLVVQCPTVFVAKFEFSHKDSRTLRNQSCTTSYHRNVSSSNTPKAVGLCATCNLLVPEVAETAILLLMMGGIVTRNMESLTKWRINHLLVASCWIIGTIEAWWTEPQT